MAEWGLLCFLLFAWERYHPVSLGKGPGAAQCCLPKDEAQSHLGGRGASLQAGRLLQEHQESLNMDQSLTSPADTPTMQPLAL